MSAGRQAGVIVGDLIVTTNLVRLVWLWTFTGLALATLATLADGTLIIVSTAITIDLIGAVITISIPVARLIHFKANTVVAENTSFRTIDRTWVAPRFNATFREKNGVVGTARCTHLCFGWTLSFNTDLRAIRTTGIGVTLVIRIVNAGLPFGTAKSLYTTAESLDALTFQTHQATVTLSIIYASGAQAVGLSTACRYWRFYTIVAEGGTE
jgi:hypothetical protein